MGLYTSAIRSFKKDLAYKESIEAKLEELKATVQEKETLYYDLIEASKLISALADKQSANTLDYITDIINKALSELFKANPCRIYLEKKLHANRYAHINLRLIDSAGREMNLKHDSGTGLQQVISFLFSLCLISLSGKRCLMIHDEVLGGTHAAAKETISELIKIFAKDFQFVMVEYGYDEIGKIYSIEQLGTYSEAYDISGQKYNPREIYPFSNPDEGKDGVSEPEEDDLEDEVIPV